MKKHSKVLILISCGLLLLVFMLPLWYIKLDAPQYPGGLDMYIWINKITGTDEFTLQNINILNHYIGMEAIHPDSFQELVIMPYVVIIFIVTGLLGLFINSKKYLLTWLALLMIGGAVGLIDFYLWQQAFGNNLDPEAPIKIPGMTYSPPFLGVKEILNIKATSLPHFGGLAFGLAIIAAMSAIYLEFKSTTGKAMNNKRKTGYKAAVLLFLFLASCSPKPQPIEYRFDACSFCKMTITDERYGTELVTKKGKVYKFDSIECLAMQVSSPENDNPHGFILVTDFKTPGQFIDAQGAWFLKSKKLPSPMGMNLTAFGSEKNAKGYMGVYGGVILSWEEIKKLSITSNDQVNNHHHQERQHNHH